MIDEDFYKANTSPVLVALPRLATTLDLYGLLNELVAHRVIAIAVKYCNVDLSIIRFEPGERDWVECIIDNPMGNQFGELRIRVKGFPPILVYSL
jgi:hypothetical protein